MNGYNNLTAQYGQYYQNLMPQQPTNSNSSLMTVLVSSEEEVNNYPVAAGMTVMLMDFGHKRFWLKSTAMNGVPQAPRVFTMEEISLQPPKMVTREEFDTLNAKLDKLISSLGGAD